MTERPRFFDDLAGMAGGAFSAITGLRDEAETMMRGRMDEMIRRLELVRREELEAVQEMAARARAGQEAAELRLRDVEARLSALERATTGHTVATASTVGDAAISDAGGASAGHDAPDPAGVP